MHSPPLSASGASGLKVPISSMLGHGPSYKPHKAKLQSDYTVGGYPQGSGASKGLLTSSSSCKTIRTIIMEGGSSSSEETKRPSIVQEQKTEEDDGDSNSGGKSSSRGYQLFRDSQQTPKRENQEGNQDEDC